uniref:COMM domain containing 6 n=1 Tax=Ovis aries TaxID=9940 RepID=A0AC11BSW5_SHEEP
MVGTLNRAMEESSEPQLDAKSKVTNQLIDFQWKLGMAVSSDSCRSLKYPYVAVMLKVADHSGQVKNKSFEMTIPQFQGVKQSDVVSRSAYMHMFSSAWPVFVFWLVHQSIYI